MLEVINAPAAQDARIDKWQSREVLEPLSRASVEHGHPRMRRQGYQRAVVVEEEGEPHAAAIGVDQPGDRLVQPARPDVRHAVTSSAARGSTSGRAFELQQTFQQTSDGLSIFLPLIRLTVRAEKIKGEQL